MTQRIERTARPSVFGEVKMDALNNLRNFLDVFEGRQARLIRQMPNTDDTIDPEVLDVVATVRGTEIKVDLMLADLHKLWILAQPNSEVLGRTVMQVIDGYQNRIHRQLEIFNTVRDQNLVLGKLLTEIQIAADDLDNGEIDEAKFIEKVLEILEAAP